jgi:PBP1b-binding outer membrane lipoprotein LpoB
MHIKILKFILFVLSILAVECAVTGCSNEMDSVEKQPAQPERKQVTVSQVTEKKNVRLTDKTGTPLDTMSDSQIAQMKRSGCRLIEEVIPHDYKK